MIDIFIRILLFFISVIVLLSSFCYIPVGYVLRKIDEDFQLKVASKIFYGFLTVVNFFMSRILEFDGENILDKKENYLIISNHVNEYDFLVFSSLFKDTETMENLKFVVKPEMKNMLGIYQILDLLNFLPIKRNILFDEKIITDYCDKVKDKKSGVNMIIFPEGTIITNETLARTNEYRESKGLKIFKNVLSPKYRGFKIMFDTMRKSHISKVMNLTFFYSNGNMPNLFEMLFTSKKFKINYKIEIVDMEDIENAQEFIEEKWEEKENWIEEKKEQLSLLNTNQELISLID